MWKNVILAVLLGASLGCTLRYSQSLAGRIPDTKGDEVRSSETGFTLLSIKISDPTPAHEQAMTLLGPCSELHRVEVDYRELSFFLFGIPRVTVTAKCVR